MLICGTYHPVTCLFSFQHSRADNVMRNPARTNDDPPATRPDEGSGSRNRYLTFVVATVAGLERIKGNPTTAKIENLLIDLQSLTLDQDDA